MRPIVIPLFVVLVAGCSRTPAPAPAPVETVAAPATLVTTPVAPAAPTITGTPCMAATEGSPPSPFLADTPAGVAQRFYELHAADAAKGVPEADELAQLAPMLTRGLVAALERARAERDREMAAHPGDKPPFVEGALFASLFEGYTHARPITVATEGDDARVPVCFAFADASGRTEWTDTVVLRKEEGTWRIDDVAYGGQWDFANTGTLRDALPREP